MHTLKERDSFQSRWGFILACIGSAVGMGNIWRFPAMVSQYGGMTFLLPYLIFVVLIGSSGVIGEFSLGRYAGAGPLDAFGVCTRERLGRKRPGQLIGLIPVFGSLGLAIGYTVVVGWIFKYTFMALSGGLYALGTDMAAIGGTFDAAAPQTATIPQSMDVIFSGTAGNNLWLVIGLAASLAIMAMGIGGGIEKANKVMMPVLFGLLLCLAVYVGTLPGSGSGYSYIFTFDPNGLKKPDVWIFAFGQAFFSLSVGGNGSVVYGSYLPRDRDLASAARNVAVFDTLAAMLAALVIIPAMAVGGAELSSGGPGLMFVFLVNVFNGMPGGRVVGAVFFVCVLFAGVSSIVNLYEAPVATCQEKFHMGRVPAVTLVGIVGGAVAICIQGVTSQWMDAVSIYICPLGAMLAGVMFFWVLKQDSILKAVNGESGTRIGGWFIPLGKYVYVPLALCALVAGAVLGPIG